MGIHHTYKAHAGERALKRQGKQIERQRRSHNRKILKQQQQKENNNNYNGRQPGGGAKRENPAMTKSHVHAHC